MVLGPFAETKGPRLPGRNPATQNITWAREWGNTRAMPSLTSKSSNLPSLTPPSRIGESAP